MIQVVNQVSKLVIFEFQDITFKPNKGEIIIFHGKEYLIVSIYHSLENRNGRVRVLGTIIYVTD